MTDLVDGEFVDSWLQRARAAGASDARVSVSPVFAVRALATEPSNGWDPWEVWLRHIDQPRRQLQVRRLKLAE